MPELTDKTIIKDNWLSSYACSGKDRQSIVGRGGCRCWSGKRNWLGCTGG